MEHWEFLLQKDGDHSWLPLDSPTVEILEGRYRIVARSSRAHREIATRIIHHAIAENPPKRRVQKRSGRTNPQGLLVIIPFTRLEPGIWEFQCSSGDLMADLVGKPWSVAVQLQVLQQESDDLEPDDLEPEGLAVSELSSDLDAANSISADLDSADLDSADLDSADLSAANLDSADFSAVDRVNPIAPEPDAGAESPDRASPPPLPDRPRRSPVSELDASEPELARILDTPPDDLHQLTEALSEQLVDDVLREFDLFDLPDPYGQLERESAIAASDSAIPPLAVPARSLVLHQEALIAHRGETVTLTGHIESGEEPGDRANGDRANQDSATALSTALGDAVSEAQVQLWLRDPQGLEVLQRDRVPLSNLDHRSSFTFSFTLPRTLSTRLLVGEVRLCVLVSDAAIVLDTQSFTLTVSPTELVEELTKLNQVLTQDSEQPVVEFPSALSARMAEDSPSPAIDLSFLKSIAPTTPEPPAPTQSIAGQLPPQLYQPNPTQPRSRALDLPNFSVGAVQPEETSVEATADPPAPEPSAPELSVPELSVPEPLLAQTVEPETIAAIAASDAEETEAESAFRSLNLQGRFLTRLSALAIDDTAASWLDSSDAPLGPSHSQLSGDTEQLAHEVVVDDDPPPRDRAPLDDRVNLLVLPEDEPVPVPELHVSTGEIVAGKSVNVRVKLPNLLPRIFVKLWINDVQTRSLLSDPRWLVDFLPDGHGALEATIALTVPLGSLEIRFEAIAVEMQTQRESRKATVDRAVIPPDLPALSLDDLNSY